MQFSYGLKDVGRGRSIEGVLVDGALEKITNYLSDPFSNGLYKLTFDWVSEGGISKDVMNMVYKETNGKDYIVLASGKRKRKINLTKEWNDSVVQFVGDKISFLLSLFDFMVRRDEDISEDDGGESSRHHEIVEMVLDLLDYDILRREYDKAYTYFFENIWDEKFRTQLPRGIIHRNKSGNFFIVSGPQHKTNCTVVAWEEKPLKAFIDFLVLVGKAESCTLMPVFSPEEELFEPYPDILSLVYSKVFTQEHLLPTISKGLERYAEHNYLDCVGSMGIAGEDILTQIYETLFREQLDKGLTTGQLLDEIQRRVSMLFKSPEPEISDVSNFYLQIKDGLASDRDKGEVALHIIRSLIGDLHNADKMLFNKIDKANKPEKKYSIFPGRIQNLLNDLIRYRNAAAHKSRVPIGPYEARRSTYCLVVLFMWWSSEKSKVNWSSDAQQVIKDFVLRNNPRPNQ